MKDKATYVRGMFSAIAGRYDLLNTLLSFRRDRYWRSSTVSCLGLSGHETVLDVATGTGKLADELGQQLSGKGRVVGIDFCREMLCRAKAKDGSAEFVLATAERAPFPDNTFDCATIGFALRNVPDVERMLLEITRVVKSGGKVVCLEFSRPRHRIFRTMHRLYLFVILPLMGRAISGDREAYLYLPRSIMEFHEPDALHNLMRNAGLTDTRSLPLTCGVVSIHTGTKA
jgi:demethylmenaquinone methyltransferase/2-methoxy-6-polyprenyl-1,4-benzoquinol methylase